MKILYSTAIILALAAPAIANSNGNDVIGNTGIAAGGDIVGDINSGPGAGSTIAPTASSTSTATAVAAPVTIADGGSATAEGGKGGKAEAKSELTVPKNPRQAPAVFAPGLVAQFDCLGSNVGGITTPLGGASLGGTTVNEDCINVYLSRELERKGDKNGSWGVLCESEKVRKHSAFCPMRDEDVEAIERSEHLPVSSGSPAKH